MDVLGNRTLNQRLQILYWYKHIYRKVLFFYLKLFIIRICWINLKKDFVDNLVLQW